MISIVHKIVFVLCSAEALICMFLCLPLPAFATKLVVDMYRGGSSSTMTTVYYTLLAVVGILLLNAVYEVTTVQNVTVGLTDGSLCTDSLAVAYLCGFTLLLTRLSRRLFDLTAEHYVMVLNNKMVEEQKAKAAAQKEMVDKMLAAEKTGGKVAAPAEEEAQKKKDDALQKQKDNQAAEYIRMVDKNMAQEKELAMLQSFKEKQDAQVKDLKGANQQLQAQVDDYEAMMGSSKKDT